MGLILAIGGGAAYLLIVVLYFFKGAAWAGSSLPKPGVRPLPASEVMSRLESVNTLDIPVQIQPGARAGELVVSWRYADAKWIDLARARGMRRLHQIKLTLDEAKRTVRATEYAAAYDWSAGRGGASIEWKASLGIVFFQYDKQKVLGLQLDDQGRLRPALAYSYTFNLQELKAPLIQSVTAAGWTWRPVVWLGPSWLRWLTD
jgi:hypothetical protein